MNTALGWEKLIWTNLVGWHSTIHQAVLMLHLGELIDELCSLK